MNVKFGPGLQENLMHIQLIHHAVIGYIDKILNK